MAVSAEDLVLPQEEEIAQEPSRSQVAKLEPTAAADSIEWLPARLRLAGSSEPSESGLRAARGDSPLPCPKATAGLLGESGTVLACWERAARFGTLSAQTVY